MLVIGLTGGIATGKSSVSSLLAAHSIPVVDADLLAREVVAPGTPGLRAIARAFGAENVLLPSGELDRKALGAIIFADAQKRKVLNGIVHPAVRRALLWGVVRAWLRGERVCVLDVPLLIEGPLWKLVSKVVVVYCDPATQLARLTARDGSDAAAAQARIDAQLPIDAKRAYADVVLPNTGSPAALAAAVDQFVARLAADAGWWWRVEWLVPPVGLARAAWCVGARALRRWWTGGPARAGAKRE